MLKFVQQTKEYLFGVFTGLTSNIITIYLQRHGFMDYTFIPIFIYILLMVVSTLLLYKEHKKVMSNKGTNTKTNNVTNQIIGLILKYHSYGSEIFTPTVKIIANELQENEDKIIHSIMTVPEIISYQSGGIALDVNSKLFLTEKIFTNKELLKKAIEAIPEEKKNKNQFFIVDIKGS